MLSILLMIIILIIIIVLIVRYIYVQAHILSSKEFRKTAEKKAVKMKFNSPKITCDYCGYIINTDKHKRCPNCGAVYGDDKELKKPYKVDEIAVEKMADNAAKDAVLRAHKKGLNTLKQLRIAIIALVCVFVITGIYSVIYYNANSLSNRKYRQNEELKINKYTDYKLIESPEVTILDQDDVTLRLMSVYANENNGKYNASSYNYRIGFSLTNKRNEPIHLILKCVGINGRSKSGDYIYVSSYFKGNSDVLFYENVYGEYFDSINEMVIGKCSLGNDDGNFYEKNTMNTIELNDKGYTVITADKDMGSVIFENDKIRVRSLEKEERNRGYDMWIENLSDHNYYIESSDIKVDDTNYDAYVLYKTGLPAGYTLHHDSVCAVSKEFKERSENAKVEMSLSFSDPDDPKNDFSTGYITLS